MMDLELHISQYIDGELSGEEEAELHHMLAVSPEARSLFREHLTLHTLARDERVLHRPEQVMRDDLFARLHAEEGMKSSAVVLASTAAGAAIFPNAGSRVAHDRSPIASREDERTEERRRRRRLIPILIPLLLCMIVGGVWYSGGFDGLGGSEEYANSGIGSNAKPSTATSDRDYTERTEIPDTLANDETLALNGSASSSASDHTIRSHQPEHPVSATPSPRAAARRVREPEPETFASRDDADGGHDVLGISPPTLQAGTAREHVSPEPLADATVNFGRREENAVSLGPNSLSEDVSFSFAASENDESYPPLEENMSLAFSPQMMSSPISMREGFVSRDADFSGSTDLVQSDDVLRVDGVETSGPISVTMSNSVPLPVDLDRSFGSLHLVDSVTRQPVIVTVDNMSEVAARLKEEGVNLGLDSESIAFEQSMADGNTGSRAINPYFSYGGGASVSAVTATSEEKGRENPVIMGSVASDRNNVTAQVKSDSVIALKDGQEFRSDDRARKASTSSSPDIAESHRDYSAAESAALSSSAPRRLSFFVGLDQSVGATVTAVEASIPFPGSSFSDNRGLYSETRAVFGVEFDNGRQRVFAAVGGWGYDERESFRSRMSAVGPVNTVTTTIREEARTAYEFWGGAGYRYNIEVTRDWNLGAEVCGGIGGNFVHAGLSIPVGYELKDNLQLEITPGIRYRESHNTADPVTTGTPPDNYEERLVTPRDERHVQAIVGIGLILLFR